MMIDHLSTYAADYPATKAFYEAVLPKMKPGIHGKAVVKDTVEGMVSKGEVSMLGARSEAEAAGEAVAAALPARKRGQGPVDLGVPEELPADHGTIPPRGPAAGGRRSVGA